MDGLKKSVDELIVSMIMKAALADSGYDAGQYASAAYTAVSLKRELLLVEKEATKLKE